MAEFKDGSEVKSVTKRNNADNMAPLIGGRDHA